MTEQGGAVCNLVERYEYPKSRALYRTHCCDKLRWAKYIYIAHCCDTVYFWCSEGHGCKKKDSP